MSDRVAVTGASGWIGREVCAWLVAQGHAVRPLTRSGELPGGFGLDLTAAENDPRWQVALRGCTAVVHCAAHVHRPQEAGVDKILFELVNVAGTAKLLAACARAGVGRFVLVSSSSVYDWPAGGPVGEEGVLRPVTAYADSKLKAEGLVRDSSLDWRIARLATVFGPGDKANFQRLARALKARRFVIPGRGDARKSVLAVDRAGELLGRLATQRAAGRNIFNLASPHAPTLREICRAFTRCCGFASAPAAPLWMLQGGAKLGDAARVLGLPAPLTTDTLAKLTTSTVLDVGKMQQEFPGLNWADFEETLSPGAHYYASG